MTNRANYDSTAASSPAAGMPVRGIARLRERQSAKQAARRMVLLAGVSAIGFAAAAVAFSWTVDPLQHYRKAWYPPVYSSEERYQNAGLARNYSYDTIILGTSMTENFSPNAVGKALGGKVMKLPLRGSVVSEQYETAKLALSTGQVKRVLWGLDYFALREESDTGEGTFPGYLYDDKLWNDYPYWFSITPYTELAKGAAKKLFSHHGTELETLDSWDSWTKFDKRLVLSDYKEAQQTEAYFGLNEDPLADVQESFNTYVLPLVKEYPQVQFDFYYPPYSILRHAVWRQTNPVRYDNQMTMRKWMFEQLDMQPNASVFDFQAESRWTFDLDQYKDLSHHRGSINTEIAEAVGRKDAAYLLTRGNIDEHNSQLNQQVRTFVIRDDDFVTSNPVLIMGEEVDFTSREEAGKDEVLVPAKELAAALKMQLVWDAGSKTITLQFGKHVVKMTTGEAFAIVDDQKKEAPSPAKLIKNKLHIPLIFVTEAVGLTIDQDVRGPAVTAFLVH
ncbi:copper amine oxidase N-terminal domain-containing protein [Paenibacillus kobensis]|uniref:copper amine oxidase N-terminal domain-containing protein n=1 Tax=Paenibacillus kobensis TaxID=59841 RepID=UPI000FDBD1C7|nr:copper amine oxidase N-terminal domain-containing protein [Paenibacillus kobensis]